MQLPTTWEGEPPGLVTSHGDRPVVAASTAASGKEALS